MPSARTSPPSPPEGESQASKAVGRAINRFVAGLDSLETTFPLTTAAIDTAQVQADTAFAEFVAYHCKSDDSTTPPQVLVPFDQRYRFRRLITRANRTLRAADLVPKAMLVALVSHYDAYLGELLRALFLAKPEALNSSERPLTLAQLLEFGTIPAATEYVLEKEVETVLRQSHAEQFDWLENKFGLPLRVGLAAWPTFIEITERRNLLVHNDGVVTSQYLSVCRKHKVSVPPETTRGTRLEVNAKYFSEAYATLFEIGVKLGHVLWRKVLPEALHSADDNLITHSYELLQEQKYSLAIALLSFGTETLKRHGSERNRRVLTINFAQAHKWSGDHGRCVDILSADDWSATSDDFRLAAAALREDWSEALGLVKRLGKDGPVTKADYRDWPVFEGLRKHEGFSAVFREVFGEELALASTQPTPPREQSDA